MYGAILGDIIGSSYDLTLVKKELSRFLENSVWTDDTVMTIAVADTFLATGLVTSEDALREQLVKSLRHYEKLYPKAGYGLRFWKWLHSWRPKRQINLQFYQGE